jgi:carbonic anhydrase/acetyltransferase-like protein (isoleucine patch superfamily)
VTRKRGYSIRSVVRDALSLVCVVLTLPLWVAARLEALLTRSESVFGFCSELLSLVPGQPGLFLRRAFYCMTLEACALDCWIGFGTTFAHRQVRIGRGVLISNRCSLGMVTIEDHAAIGSNTDILSGRHQHHVEQVDKPVLDQAGAFHPVRIGCNSWIGNSTVVMADIGPHCIIGAGSVVVKPIPAGAVAVGNPATVKKRRPEFAARTPETQWNEPPRPSPNPPPREPSLTPGATCSGF